MYFSSAIPACTDQELEAIGERGDRGCLKSAGKQDLNALRLTDDMSVLASFSISVLLHVKKTPLDKQS